MAPATKAKYKYPIHKKNSPPFMFSNFQPRKAIDFSICFPFFWKNQQKSSSFFSIVFWPTFPGGKIFGGWGSATNQSVTKLENVWKSCSAIYYMLLILQI